VTTGRLEVADVFRQHKQEFFARWGKSLTRQQCKAFRDICACRTEACGARLEQCDHCGERNLQFNSCRNRSCPQCQSSARDRWLAKTAQELLPVRYCHVVFTLPGQLAPLALQNPKLIYGMLFRAASEALLTIAADPKRMGARLGFLAVLHTWNQKLNPHPHLHCLVPAGGISSDQSRWIYSRERFFLPVQVLGRRFRRQFLLLLGVAWQREQLRLFGSLAYLRKAGQFHQLVSKLRRLNWVVYARRPFGSPEHVLRYLARYTHRVALASGRLVSTDNGQVSFRWRDSADGNQQKVMTLEAVEFIHRYLQHVLPAGFVKIRHFGFLANACRKAGLSLARKLAGTLVAPDVLTPRQKDAVQRRCPACGVGYLCVLGRIPAGVPFPLGMVDSS
jgi:Putative transposase/Transposase zinc-binding domain